ncbi:hypothetical protein XH99_00020 [Bradyrhizobium nanningense]|uniref:Uncharacterized protein n=1 Tax=Bradyrhizobium nanningense TaxID=1325118 RepID=A0A4Q0SHQ8_9BRAD|nr:hypothetical protein [Bradyrhizobium nanningense]RXH38692.1 hypothetical protein XH99_00020 [Bradyrhizobium nanningense]
MSERDDIKRQMQRHLQTVHDIAVKILDSSDTGQRAFVTAAGILAAVIHTSAVAEHREEVVDAAIDAVRDHIKLLDELAGTGTAMN